MNAQQTISDSKELFYKEFPYVIPHIYRRVADELIVELNLTSHLRDFKQDDLFAAGLNKTFSDLTLGYQPTEHLDQLFAAICKSSGFDPIRIKEQSEKLKKLSQNLTLEKIEAFLKQKPNANDVDENQIKKIFTKKDKCYSRLISIGILDVMDKLTQNKSAEPKAIEIAKEIAQFIGLSEERIEKDISSYLRSIEKIEQFIELQKELNKKNK